MPINCTVWGCRENPFQSFKPFKPFESSTEKDRNRTTANSGKRNHGSPPFRGRVREGANASSND
jgi:hypothetical protein